MLNLNEQVFDEEIGIKADGTLGGETNPRLYGPASPNYTLSKYNPTGQSLTGDGGYQIGNNLKAVGQWAIGVIL